MIWHVLGILAFVVIYNIWRYYHEDDDYEYSPVEQSTSDNNQTERTYMEERISTRQLALNTIEKIGSEPQYTEEGRIQFEYQGVIFLMEAVNDCMFVNLIWPWCHSFSKFDIDEFARVRQIVNEINLRDTLSVIYSITDSDDVALHIKKHFLFISQIPQLEEYLKMILNSFFRTARTLELEIEKCRMQECEKQI
jgi:hypothetical protein